MAQVLKPFAHVGTRWVFWTPDLDLTSPSYWRTEAMDVEFVCVFLSSGFQIKMYSIYIFYSIYIIFLKVYFGAVVSLNLNRA